MELRNQLKNLRALLKSPDEEKADSASASESPQVEDYISNIKTDKSSLKQNDENFRAFEKSNEFTDLDTTSIQKLSGNHFESDLSPAGVINSDIFSENSQINSTEIQEEMDPFADLPAEKSSFGCLKLQKPLSVSSRNKIGDYYADAYITPDVEKNLTFRLGTVNFPSPASSIEENGIRFSEGKHQFYEEARPIKILQLGIQQNSDDSPFILMSEESKTQYLENLHELYTRALTHAFTKGARQIALEPCRKGNQILSKEELQTLAESVRQFQEQHPETKLQVVLMRATECDPFKENQRLKH